MAGGDVCKSIRRKDFRGKSQRFLIAVIEVELGVNQDGFLAQSQPCYLSQGNSWIRQVRRVLVYVKKRANENGCYVLEN